MQALPSARQAWTIGSAFISNRGLVLPMLEWNQQLLLATIFVALVALAAMRFSRYLFLLLLAFPIMMLLAPGALPHVDRPQLRGFNFVGGVTLTPEFVALVIGLVIYTSAYIAEIVRSGLQAVPKGQWEAASALGIGWLPTVRLIIFPQAMRVILPPLVGEYLNLTKNTTLAVAIGYQDVMSIGETTLNQTGQSIETITLIMAFFLSVSLITSAGVGSIERVLARRWAR
jgi:general L-amino acid transport system permease protein